MSRRSYIIIIIVFAMFVFAVMWLRPLTERPRELEQTSSLSVTDKNIENTGAAVMANAAPEAFERSAASSDSVALPGRGARRNTDQKIWGERSFDAQGASLVSDALFAGSSWRIWKGVTAYPKSAQASHGKRVGEVNGYDLIDEGSPVSLENFDPARPLVVLSQNGTGRVGVMTGTVVVTLEEGASADFLTQSAQIRIVGASPEIQTYFVTPTQVPFNMRDFLESLKEAPEVRQVEMEILDRQYEKF